MSLAFSIDRRDPISWVLRLGTALFRAQRYGLTGEVEIRDQGRVHGIRLVDGGIADVLWDGERIDQNSSNRARLWQQTEQLFRLPRPHVLWASHLDSKKGDRIAHPDSMVITGIMSREDLFDPKSLVKRIPVEVLKLDRARIARARDLPLCPEEIAFIERLATPTPIPMLLWKRGLAPRHAAALLVALNLIGTWEGTWDAGDLPRMTNAVQIVRRLKKGFEDHEVLGIGQSASAEEIDQAFRRLSFELHPDKQHGLSEIDKKLAGEAFVGASAAYTRLKRSRRSRPVQNRSGETMSRSEPDPCPAESWSELMARAQRARQNGQDHMAKVFFLKALAKSPPPDIQKEIALLLKRTA